MVCCRNNNLHWPGSTAIFNALNTLTRLQTLGLGYLVSFLYHDLVNVANLSCSTATVVLQWERKVHLHLPQHSSHFFASRICAWGKCWPNEVGLRHLISLCDVAHVMCAVPWCEGVCMTRAATCQQGQRGVGLFTEWQMFEGHLYLCLALACLLAYMYVYACIHKCKLYVNSSCWCISVCWSLIVNLLILFQLFLAYCCSMKIPVKLNNQCIHAANILETIDAIPIEGKYTVTTQQVL